MIELVKEKSYTTKDQKLQLYKQSIMFDKFKLPKFTCAVINSKTREYDLSFFLGLNNGNIIGLKLSKQKSLFHKFEEFITLSCKDDFKHRGPVFTMISEVIDGVSCLFSGGIDGTIKFWNIDMEEQKESHYITTIFGHKGTVLSMAFSKSRNILITSSTDMTIKFWRMKDNFDRIMNPLFQCILSIRDFDLKKKKEEEKPFWINTLSLKESDIIELYAGDTKGRVHFYHYIDASYVKAKEAELKNKKYTFDNFNHIKTSNPHIRTIIKVVHSIFDSMIYSIGFDNYLIGYNQKTDTKYLQITNSSKNHFTCLSINYFTQELIIGDDKGGLSFIKIFNKSEIKLKLNQNGLRIFYIHNLEIFNDQEHLLVVTEDNVEIYRIKRETKVFSVQYHDAEVIKLFVQEPIKFDKKILEDAK